jgi:hypothetical protein
MNIKININLKKIMTVLLIYKKIGKNKNEFYISYFYHFILYLNRELI